MYPYIPYELSFLQSIASFRPEWLHPFILPLNNCDTAPYYMSFGAFAFIFIKPRLGQRCWALMALAFIATYYFKSFFMQPRPFVLDPALGLLSFNSKYGLPSGAAMVATCIAMLVRHDFQSKVIRRLAWAYALLIMFSRIYLGVHFISDVIVGCLMGLMLSHVFLRYIEPVESFIDKQSKLKILIFIGIALGFGHVAINLPSYQFGLSTLCAVIASRVLLRDFKGPPLYLSMKILFAGFSVALVYGGLLMVHTFKTIPVVMVAPFIILTMTVCWKAIAKLNPPFYRALHTDR